MSRLPLFAAGLLALGLTAAPRLAAAKGKAKSKGPSPYWGVGLGGQWVVGGWQPVADGSDAEVPAERRRGGAFVADARLGFPVHKRVLLGGELVGSWATVRRKVDEELTDVRQTMATYDALASFMVASVSSFGGPDRRFLRHTVASVGPSFLTGTAAQQAGVGSVDAPERHVGAALRLGDHTSFSAKRGKAGLAFGAAGVVRLFPLEREEAARSDRLLGDAIWMAGLDLTLSVTAGGPGIPPKRNKKKPRKPRKNTGPGRR